MMSMKKTYNELSIASNPLNIDSAIELGSLDSSSAQHLDQVEQCSEHLAVNTSALGADRLDLSTNTASRFSCFLNLANTILGSGMLGMPYAIANTGWLFGSVLTLLCGYFSSLALHSLAMCALEVPGDSSFFSVANNVMPTLSSLIDLAVALKCFGVATSYLIVMGDLMPEVMEQFGGSSLSQSRELWVLVGFGIVAPLSYLRSLDSLKFTSFLSLGFVFFLAALVVFYSSGVDGLDPCRHAGADCEGPTRPVEASLETLRILPIFIFGFTCQQNIFAVVNELQDPTPRRVDSVIMSSIGCALAVYLVVACCGYFTYGSKLQSDILLNYPETYLTSVARLLVCLLVAFSYPLQAHPARKCILTLAAKLLDREYQEGAHDEDSADRRSAARGGAVAVPTQRALEREQTRFLGITTCFLGLSLLIGLTVTDLGVVLALVGATGSTVVSYIAPGFLFYYTFAGRGPEYDRPRRLALLQGCLGLVLVPVCVTAIFL